MAVSKTQNERPAINALIDLANGLETATQGHTVQISNLQGALSSEISSRTSADTLLGNRILAEETARTNADTALEDAIDAEETARETAITSIDNKLGDTFTAQNSVSDFAEYVLSDINNFQSEIEDLQAFIAQLNSMMRFGVGGSIPITVSGNDYYDGIVTYGRSFPDNFVSFVFPAFLSAFEQTDLDVKVNTVLNTGFSYTVINRSATAKQFIICYFALGQAIS